MKPSQLNLDDFPDSPYAAELRKAHMRLRFPPPLEQEYLDDHLRWIRPRARIWTALALMISLGFTAAKWLQDGYLSVLVIAHLLVILPISAGMAWLAWRPGRLRLYLRAAGFIAPVFGIAVALSVSNAMGIGHTEDLASLLLLVIASFFFMGLLYRAALTTGLAIVTAYAVGAALADLPAMLYLKSLLFLAIAAAAGATIAHEVERSYRKRYLEQGLIGELVDRDGLTGLKNRRAFDEHLLRVWQQSLRANSTLAVVLIDIDFFKPYNDHFGYQVGDVVLCVVV
ncbi:MAG TPA: diguanylate cyclase [Woeseiaceae bacterium]|nr:diguanylate cyclase [Woeseiaceae bacterium]